MSRPKPLHGRGDPIAVIMPQPLLEIFNHHQVSTIGGALAKQDGFLIL
jgi:hypothetical protein